MANGGAQRTEPTLLKALLRARHWQKHSTFAREWDKAARTIDPTLVGTWPRHAQFYRWLRGELRELPYPDSCRVLEEAFFPQHSVNELFEPCTDELVDKPLRRNATPIISARQSDLANALDISLTQLAGQASYAIDLSGDWWCAWRMSKNDIPRIDTHPLTAHQNGEMLQLDAEKAPAEGSYR